jgi:3-deoxy-7-phosphoheptulonate synthase
VTKGGHSAIVSTTGNEDCHLILRGGKQPNYDAANVDAAAKGMAEAGIPARIMIDFSHANSSKNPAKQVDVAQDVAQQLAAGDDRICGVMAESHLKSGRQDLMPGKALAYGVSITDGCVGWEETRGMLEVLAEGVRKRRIKAEADAQ